MKTFSLLCEKRGREKRPKILKMPSQMIPKCLAKFEDFFDRDHSEAHHLGLDWLVIADNG